MSTKKRRDIKCIFAKFAHIDYFVQEIVESPPGPRILRSFASSLVEAIICQTKHQVFRQINQTKSNISFARSLLGTQKPDVFVICQAKHQVQPYKNSVANFLVPDGAVGDKVRNGMVRVVAPVRQPIQYVARHAGTKNWSSDVRPVTCSGNASLFVEP